MPLLPLFVVALGAGRENMNQGGVPYAISNAKGAGYPLDFFSSVSGDVEFFDVYGEVQTRYSQVYWTRNDPIDLPPALVRRFDGKVMSIVGYEVDQVTHDGPRPPPPPKDAPLSGFACYPSCAGRDTSVPIYNAYNHHYFSWLISANAEVYDLARPVSSPNPTRTAVKPRQGGGGTGGYPSSIVFKENPGGEYRKSYHGYPSGFAQLIHSPSHWVVEPMQIDTHNRSFGINEQAGLQRSFLPKINADERTDRGSGLSPLIECPCSDRVTRQVLQTPVMLAANTTCDAASERITTAAACFGQAAALATLTANLTVSDSSLPVGCSLRATHPRHAPSRSQDLADTTYEAVFNSLAHTAADCSAGGGGGGKPFALRGHANLSNLTTLTIEYEAHEAVLAFSGPSAGWYGVGFDATDMHARPYAIIVDGWGNVTERRLGDHNPGAQLPPSVRVVSAQVIDGWRTVVMRRPLATSEYALPADPGQLNVITAIGNTKAFQRHHGHSASRIVLLPAAAGASVCVCTPQPSAYLVYMDTVWEAFDGYECADEPRGDMLRRGDGTGRRRPNAACHDPNATGQVHHDYHGGLRCCQHSWFLTDREQDKLIPQEVDSYYLKWRYYFQEYVPPATAPQPSAAFSAARGGSITSVRASHKHLHHWVFLIDAAINDYEEDNARYGDASVGKITAQLTVREMASAGTDEDRKAMGNFTSMVPIVMTPHCHAPSCLREELWNADTGELICRVEGRYGKSDAVFDEKDYIALAPCLWGHQEGLHTPIALAPNTTIRAVKIFNNTYRHLGQMAQWTGLAAYDVDPY